MRGRRDRCQTDTHSIYGAVHSSLLEFLLIRRGGGALPRVNTTFPCSVHKPHVAQSSRTIDYTRFFQQPALQAPVQILFSSTLLN